MRDSERQTARMSGRPSWACPRCGDPGYVVGTELRCGNPDCDDTHAYDPVTGDRADYEESYGR